MKNLIDIVVIWISSPRCPFKNGNSFNESLPCSSRLQTLNFTRRALESLRPPVTFSPPPAHAGVSFLHLSILPLFVFPSRSINTSSDSRRHLSLPASTCVRRTCLKMTEKVRGTLGSILPSRQSSPAVIQLQAVSHSSGRRPKGPPVPPCFICTATTGCCM